MKIQVNGDYIKVAENTSIEGLLAQLDMTQGRVAVEVNADIVPRSQHPQHTLHEGDRVEIVHAIGGG
ncbi:thiamine biosynthesis protein ThiS [Pseudohongiella acticola]|jgi:sulfur carrier protein|uniref:Thiamine biosynthesis protein ThiS n=1 Tax=Pseudohongiella acticola TaxID=1524254 RepID=A0A1E8CL67_9GAMM|nr:sulfur carrier protein ThiS [Pseudohongiella acticola]OFE13200.1 thiamine biosynthesis protein ThiS [Pseudohongiella acticola]